MPEGELHYVLQGHSKRWVLVGHASQREANGQAAPRLAETKRMANHAPGMRHSRGGRTLNSKPIEPGASYNALKRAL